MTILGISVGTTRTGVCVLKDGTLLDRHIHSYHSAWSDHKLRVIMNQYKRHILKRNVTAIIVKIPPLKKHTPAISRILKRLEALAREYGCEFDLVTKSELKQSLHVRSTSELILYVRQLYPELRALFEKGAANNDHGYYTKLYEAVAAAYFFEKRLQMRPEQANTTE